MRSSYKNGMMVAAIALMASGSAALAADPIDDSQQNQINVLSQQLQNLKAASGPLPGAAVVPTKIPTWVNGPSPAPAGLQYGTGVGGFVIPGTKTAVKLGGNMKLDLAWDFDAGNGSAGGDIYAVRAGKLTGGSGFALPGTPAARQTGRFSANAVSSRLNFEARTPTEYGEVKWYTEIDFSGKAAGSDDQYSSNGHVPRLRHAYGTIGNTTIGQTWTLWSDRATLPVSVLSNGPAGVESGVRQAVVQYRWDVDAAQKNQVYVGLENPFSDFLGADKETLTGTAYNNPTNFNERYPDLLIRLAHNESWGRTYLTGIVRDLTVNTLGQNLGTAAGSIYSGPANDSTVAWGVTGGTKIYNPYLGVGSDAFYLRGQAGQGIGRYMNFNNSAQNASAVIDNNGKLQTIYAIGYQVAYQHFFDDKNVWQANAIWSDQKMFQKNSLLCAGVAEGSGNNACGAYAAGTVLGQLGLPTRETNVEFNFLWTPNSYVQMGPAFTIANVRVSKGLNLLDLYGNGAAGGATTTTSGTTAVDKRLQFTTNIGF